MRRGITIIAAVSVFSIFNSCSKDAPDPLAEPIEHTSLVRGTCRQYWMYDGSTPTNLGNILTNRIIIGFKNGTDHDKKLKVLKDYPLVTGIISSSTNGSDQTDVSLQPNLTCAQVGDLLDDLAQNNHIDYVGPYFIGNFGIANFIEVEVCSTTTQAQLNSLMKKTKTEYDRHLFGNVHIYKTTKHSPKNCLDTANEFYETGLFDVAQPSWTFFLDD